ncbi:methylenetetrahydrofolate reductase [NAD(P)H] [Phycisphaera mikurensis]|uniref:Methylenetetrahydrofolate reductase n=1 Tax=Phycisphaera mikurensis (strain NBRC 102666 / KCTC 22515 / FYK2301M01) TaxID=1142394 RepID=I0IE44_PHYMF|nr:methylenetetrahydrofolate reductase [NAD(P)H] [Phycisphaera mikurensis]MBB6441337.1 methylenetetrahydrofolate reductase (NADPH) [Phycisphaera mikurensis]BAM03532.1 5,10-methylenetetrahydrofolate reductase [Phycisphaera mikurensis NBRC 102666]
MHIADLLDRGRPSFSFEFFPPKTAEASDELFATILELRELGPDFVDVTYGAGGSTRDLTAELVARIRREAELETIPHLTCVCHSREDLEAILEGWAADGVSNVLALGGDLPRDKPDWDRSRDACRHAADLVALIKQIGESGHAEARGFGVGVAGFPEGHPGTPNRMEEMDHLKAKVDAGADYICTQMFFDNHDFYDFRERCELAGVGVPIVAGIMPITSAKGMRRMAELAAGSRYPASLLKSVKRAVDAASPAGERAVDDAVSDIGVHWATEQSRDLLDHGVAGLHYYTLNRSDATRKVYKSLGITPRLAGAEAAREAAPSS